MKSPNTRKKACVLPAAIKSSLRPGDGQAASGPISGMSICSRSAGAEWCCGSFGHGAVIRRENTKTRTISARKRGGLFMETAWQPEPSTMGYTKRGISGGLKPAV